MLTAVADLHAAFRNLPLGTIAHIAAPALVLAPHPDDESLGCGGAIALACDAGTPPVVAILTDGAGSHPGSRLWPPARLRALREAEATDAVAALGLPGARLVFLGLPDTAAPVSGPGFEAAAARLLDLAARHGCRSLLAPWRHDPHCDHEAAARLADVVAARAGLALLSYPVWGWSLPGDALRAAPPVRGFRLPIGAVLERKRAAIAAHRSQRGLVITDDPDGFVLPESLLARFEAPFETFLAGA